MTSTAPAITSTEPAYRPFAVHVARTRRLSPSFLRMTFTGPDLGAFAADGLDQRIKLVLPAACGAPAEADLFAAVDWYEAWRALPDHRRNPLRTYTVRAVRPSAREVDVDVVLHGVDLHQVTTRGCGLAEVLGCACLSPAGPAVRWCAAARAGDPLVLLGPNARYQGAPSGIEWRPPSGAGTFLLAGDETAVPAVSSIVESLPAGVRAHALLEVPTQDDVLDLDVPAGVEVTWLPRGSLDPVLRGRPVRPHGSLLEPAVRSVAELLLPAGGGPRAPGASGVVPLDGAGAPDGPVLWDVPVRPAAVGGVYAWVAGEAGVVRRLRRLLVRDLGLDRTSVAFMGYWRSGRSEAA